MVSAMFVTFILRKDISCFGVQQKYSCPFGSANGARRYARQGRKDL